MVNSCWNSVNMLANHKCDCTYIHTYTHTYIHTVIHTYIHIYICTCYLLIILGCSFLYFSIILRALPCSFYLSMLNNYITSSLHVVLLRTFVNAERLHKV